MTFPLPSGCDKRAKVSIYSLSKDETFHTVSVKIPLPTWSGGELPRVERNSDKKWVLLARVTQRMNPDMWIIARNYLRTGFSYNMGINHPTQEWLEGITVHLEKDPLPNGCRWQFVCMSNCLTDTNIVGWYFDPSSKSEEQQKETVVGQNMDLAPLTMEEIEANSFIVFAFELAAKRKR